MENKLRQQLIEELQKLQSSKNYNFAKKYVDKYVDAVLAELSTQFMLATSDELETGEISFSADAVNKAAGRMSIDGKNTYIYNYFQKHKQLSIVIEKYKGNSLAGRVSKMTINPTYKNGVMQELASAKFHTQSSYLKKLQENATTTIRINTETLRRYIADTQHRLNNLQACHSDAYAEKLIAHRDKAVEILNSAYEMDRLEYIDECWVFIDSGRMQGLGVSTQCVAKEVRHAALGPCYRYDFKAASYALMTGLAKHIDSSLNVDVLTDYVRNRSKIRQRIADDIGVDADVMKGIFTAIGFGAQLKRNKNCAIFDKLKKEKYDLLVKNVEFMTIKKCFDAVTDVLLEHYSDDDFELCGRQYCSTDKDGEKRNARQKLAWIYQCLESTALGVFYEEVKKHREVRLLVHDCIYVDKQLSPAVAADIKYKLRQFFAYLDFEGDEIKPIQALPDVYVCSSYVSEDAKKALVLRQQHKAFIKAEEERAKLA